MAKQPGNKSGGRLRLIVFEADLADGDFSQITQVLQNAFKPTQVIQQRVISQPSTALPSPNGAAEDVEDLPEDSISPDSEVDAKPKKSREPRVRKVSSPEIVDDLDMHSDPSWVSFAQSRNPESNTDRFLVAAEWCRSARGLTEVSADHIFTCFKIAQWPTNKQDFSQPLRHLKATKLMGSGSERGLYKINHVGSSRVDEMGK